MGVLGSSTLQSQSRSAPIPSQTASHPPSAPASPCSNQGLNSSNRPSPNPSQNRTNFWVMAGGGQSFYNEIALEKNVLYFQRTLQAMGFDPTTASVYFANGTDGQATVRYLDETRQEQFKPPAISHLSGASTLDNFQSWLQQTAQRNDRRPVFFYFTGHGYHNRSNEDNNAMILWQEDLLSVQDFAHSLNQLPQEVPIIAMMAQCYSGSFAHFIYENGDRDRGIALQTRCGFFATIKSRPSVGCTPEVNEADYRDYSSSFFAGLSGIDRTGNPVASADYNQDDKISYAEAHAFAKVDEQTTDLPVSTVEVWMQDQFSDKDYERILRQPMQQILTHARPEREHVVRSLMQRFHLTPEQSFDQLIDQLRITLKDEPIQAAYLTRLGMELVNIEAEQTIRQAANPEQVQILDRLINCEARAWTDS